MEVRCLAVGQGPGSDDPQVGVEKVRFDGVGQGGRVGGVVDEGALDHDDRPDVGRVVEGPSSFQERI